MSGALRALSTLAIVLLACSVAGDAASRKGDPPGTRNGCAVLSGGVYVHTAQAGDSLTLVAARYGLDARSLAGDNGLPAGARLRLGQELRVDNRHIVPAGYHHGIVINVPQRMLFAFDSGRLLAAYPVAVGRADWPTPLGTFEIAVLEVDPTWDVPVSIQREMARAGQRVKIKVPPGPGNPLGDRWIGLEGTSTGIHGTNQPSSIYRFTTHGCIRLHSADARRLFDAVGVGMPVEIIYEPVLAALDEAGGAWVEVQPDVYRRAGDPLGRAAALMEENGRGDLAGSAMLRRCVQERRGRACRL